MKVAKVNVKKGLKAVKFICFFLGFALLFSILQYLFSYDKTSYTRVMEYELYNTEKNIDVLFLGSSHTYRQYIPTIIDEYLNVYSYNAGSSSQKLDASYALLVEAGKYNKLNTVFFELCPSYKGETFSERETFVETYIIGDYMHWGINKVQFLLNASNRAYYVNSFFPLIRNKTNYNYEYLSNAVALKFDEEYLNYKYPGNKETDSEWYEDRGYVANNSVIENENWSVAAEERYSPIDDNLFSEDELNILNKTVKYCKENDIRLIFISTPLTDFNLSLFGNYDKGREQITKFAENANVEYYDFNLCKPEFFATESILFKDGSHLNHYGAEKYSHLIGKFFAGEIADTELFYNTYEEKLSKMGNRVFGVVYEIEEGNKNKTIHFTPITSSEFKVYANVYKVVDSEGNTELLMKKQELNDLMVEQNETGWLSIEVLGDSPDGKITNIISIEY